MLLTTSRRPTGRIRSLCRDIARSIPRVTRINRGKLNIDGIAERALEINAERIILVDRWKRGAGKIKLFKTEPTGLASVPPTIYVEEIKLKREFREETKAVRCDLITVAQDCSTETMKIAEHLSKFVNLPLSSTKEIDSRCVASMYVSLSSGRCQITFMLLPQMIELGPRIVISKLAWEKSA